MGITHSELKTKDWRVWKEGNLTAVASGEIYSSLPDGTLRKLDKRLVNKDGVKQYMVSYFDPKTKDLMQAAAHRVIADLFCKKSGRSRRVCAVDGNFLNIRASNLYWDDIQENAFLLKDAFDARERQEAAENNSRKNSEKLLSINSPVRNNAPASRASSSAPVIKPAVAAPKVKVEPAESAPASSDVKTSSPAAENADTANASAAYIAYDPDLYKPIPDTDGHYAMDKNGEYYRLSRRGLSKRNGAIRDGKSYIQIMIDGENKRFRTDAMVCALFGNVKLNDVLFIEHINGNALDCSLDNLRPHYIKDVAVKVYRALRYASDANGRVSPASMSHDITKTYCNGYTQCRKTVIDYLVAQGKIECRADGTIICLKVAASRGVEKPDMKKEETSQMAANVIEAAAQPSSSKPASEIEKSHTESDGMVSSMRLDIGLDALEFNIKYYAEKDGLKEGRDYRKTDSGYDLSMAAVLFVLGREQASARKQADIIQKLFVESALQKSRNAAKAQADADARLEKAAAALKALAETLAK